MCSCQVLTCLACFTRMDNQGTNENILTIPLQGCSSQRKTKHTAPKRLWKRPSHYLRSLIRPLGRCRCSRPASRTGKDGGASSLAATASDDPQTVDLRTRKRAFWPRRCCDEP